MVERINGSLAREAIIAALKDQAKSAQTIREDAHILFETALDPGGLGDSSPTNSTKRPNPASVLGNGLIAVDREVQGIQPDRLVEDLMSGNLENIHQVASRINRAKISFDFAMEVRNKLIEAYRETMRMGV